MTALPKSFALSSLNVPRETFTRLRDDKICMALLGDARLKAFVTEHLVIDEKMSAGSADMLRKRVECGETHARFLRRCPDALLLFGKLFDEGNDHTLSQLLEGVLGVLRQAKSDKERVLAVAICAFAGVVVTPRMPARSIGRIDHATPAATERPSESRPDNVKLQFALLFCCERGDLRAVEAALAHVSDFNFFSGDMSPLIAASLFRHVDIVRFLLRHGANPRTTSPFFKDTPLYAAAQVGDVEIVDLLAVHGADVNMPNNDGTPPLSIALHRGHSDVARRLVYFGAHVPLAHCPSPAGSTALHWAARSKSCEVVRFILGFGSRPAREVAARDVCGQTPLILAAQSGCLDVVRLFLDIGASLEARCIHGRTALFVAAQGGHLAVVKHLLRLGAEIDAASIVGNTPLTIAIIEGHLDVARLLLLAGANVRLSTTENRVCVAVAMEAAQTAIVPLLIAAGADVNALSDDGNNSALSFACKFSKCNHVALLLAAGADLDARVGGRTVFDIATDPAIRGLLKAACRVECYLPEVQAGAQQIGEARELIAGAKAELSATQGVVNYVANAATAIAGVLGTLAGTCMFVR
jgi:uncharacterized protein